MEDEGKLMADTNTAWVAKSLSEYFIDDAVVWFIHNKGMSRVGTPMYLYVSDARRMMMYFLFEKDWCVRAIQSDLYDTCGVNLRSVPYMHYSGTFWMARSRYLKSLPYPTKWWGESPFGDRYTGEFWILHSNVTEIDRALCVHESHVDHAKEPYRSSNYIGAFIGKGCPSPVKPEFLTYLATSH